MQRSQTVCESRVFCSLVGVQTKTQLLDATQSLKIRRVDQTNHQSAFGAVVAQRNDVMNRIAIDSLGQALETYFSGLGPQSTTARSMLHVPEADLGQAGRTGVRSIYGISD